MTTQETYIVMKMIQSYYPPFNVNDEVVNKSWSAEFININFEICKRVVKKLCRERERIYAPRLNEILAGCEDEKLNEQRNINIASNRYIRCIEAGNKYYQVYDKVEKRFIQTNEEIPDEIYYETASYVIGEEQKKDYNKYWSQFTNEERYKLWEKTLKKYNII